MKKLPKFELFHKPKTLLPYEVIYVIETDKGINFLNFREVDNKLFFDKGYGDYVLKREI